MEDILVIKRDGRVVPFDPTKIFVAIQKANRALNNPLSLNTVSNLSETVKKSIFKFLKSNHHSRILIEDIQNLVEVTLFDAGYFALAKHYIIYRFQRALVRKANTTDESILSLIHNDNVDLLEENANKNAVIASTQRDLIAGEVSKDLTKRLILPEHISEAHQQGAIHFHDADYFIQPIFNCCLINIGDMLDNGTVMNGKLIESPKSFQVACTVMTQIIAAVASSQYGGQSVDIKHLAPYLRKSKQKFIAQYSKIITDPELLNQVVESRLKEELRAGVQTIQYQINTLMTTNGQTPFVTLFLNIDPDYEFVQEHALIIEEILNQRYDGIKNIKGVSVTPTFPKLIFVLHPYNNLSGGAYDYLTRLAIKCSARRMYPDFISAKLMKQTYQGNVFSPMGCRSFLSPWKDLNGKYKFEGRFNQGVVSINLPRVALDTNSDPEKFWELLDERLNICYEALMCRHNALKGTLSDVSPIHWQHGAIARLNKGETIDRFLFGGYSSISLGYIGLYELSKLMTGKSHTTPEGEEFALKVMNHLKETCDKWRQQTNIGFALYGTPAESLCYRFARIDKEKFGIIKDITDKGYYTNSYHVDVREDISAFDKLKFESQFQKISTGGCISYVEIPNMEKNLKGLEALVKFIYNNIQYAEFNTKSDYCMECGFTGEIIINDKNIWECPQCHNTDFEKMTVVRRICGYIGSANPNFGKRKEMSNRKLHL